MSLTSILAIAEAVDIQDHKFIGQTLSRNMRISTSEILTVQPFRFTFKPHSYMQYSLSRSILNTLRIADRSVEQYLNFGSTGWVNYITYQGAMTSAQIAACQWQTSSANKNLVLGSLPSISSTAYIVKTGDICQVGRYAYIVTADVQRGSNSTVIVPVHRNLITPLATTVAAVIGQYGTTISLGGGYYTGVTFPVILQEYPTYSLTPITNDSFINWSGSFSAIESVLFV